ncbi:MAG: hypothetical protein J7K04_11230 [Spirochaetales bacterium]|nr:hypothetical protein [Spirochaetales bacterium]
MEKRKTDIKKYWADKEAVLGEKLVYKSIAEVKTAVRNSKFGILYLMENNLYLEYSESGRKTLLDLFTFRPKRDKDNKTIVIPREEIINCYLVPIHKIRKIFNTDLKETAKLRNLLSTLTMNTLQKLIYGTALCVLHSRGVLIVQTPSNREWFKMLSSETIS